MVPTTGLEPVRCYSLEPESSASANSATWANLTNNNLRNFQKIVVRPFCAAILCGLIFLGMETKESIAEKTTASPKVSGPKWRSFPKVPNLLQYVSTGLFYARVQVNGKNIRKSLKAKTWSTAKLRLQDFLNRQVTAPPDVEALPFAAAVQTYEASLKIETTIKESSKQFRRWCIATLKKSWPELWKRNIEEVTEDECKAWGSRMHNQFGAQYYNNIIGTLKLILDAGIAQYVGLGGTRFQNQAKVLSRARPGKKDLVLPEKPDFLKLVAAIARQPGNLGSHLANQLEFLACSGMRAFSEAGWVTWEDVNLQREEIVVRGDPETGTKNSEIRRIPIIPDMLNLLVRLQNEKHPTGRVLKIERCGVRLRLACREIGIPPITLHDLRHLFATRCIESGVDIPTVSRWLGHKDGGALAMKTYGHLRNEHSKAMAKKVVF